MSMASSPMYLADLGDIHNVGAKMPTKNWTSGYSSKSRNEVSLDDLNPTVAFSIKCSHNAGPKHQPSMESSSSSSASFTSLEDGSPRASIADFINFSRSRRRVNMNTQSE